MAGLVNGRQPWPKKYTDRTGRFTYFFSNVPGDGDGAILCLEDDELQFSTHDGAYDEFVIPAVVDGHPVETVEGVLIPNCLTLRFEDGIREINLEGIPKGEFLELILPETLEALAGYSFAGCGSLERAVIPAGWIGRRAFANCRNLRTLELGQGVREIRGEAFRNCASLQSVELPDGLIRLGNRPGMDFEGETSNDLGAFDGCANLRRVRIGANLREIVGNPFTNCPKLAKIEISPGNPALETRGALLVERDKGILHCALRSRLEGRCTVTDDIVGIDRNAFLNCEELREADLPDSLGYVGSQAFQGCRNLRNLRPFAADEICASAFEDCAALERVDAEAEWIGARAFAGCAALRFARVWTQRLDPSAFANCPEVEIACVEARSRGILPL